MITGLIDRRILINYRVDKDVVRKLLPTPFRPKLVMGHAIAGICLIRLKDIRPKGLPAFLGIGSENGAHRIAVEWEENGVLKEGVFIPRRDSSSMLNHLAGGRVFPGIHYHARFMVEESNGLYKVGFKSSDGTSLAIEAETSDKWPSGSVFDEMSAASDFFEKACDGYSPGKNGLEGLRLITAEWKVQALEVAHVQSSYFENAEIFPEGSIEFDNALLMKGIPHEWESI